MTLQAYINSLNKRYQTGNAREHAYRGDLEQLMQTFAPTLIITNEPANVTNCGNPDFVLMQKEIPVGYVEAKDIGKDLKAKQYQEQFARYKNALDNLIITDYICFYFYRQGKEVAFVKIAEIKDTKIVSLPNHFTLFEDLFRDFATYIGQGIKSAQKLAELMAAKARLLQNILEKALDTDVEINEHTSLRGQYEGFKQMLISDLTVRQFADVYAQTLAYGMFAARLHDTDLDTFSREEAANNIPHTNPFLRKLFQSIAGYDIDSRIKTTVDNLAEVFRAADVRALLQNFDKHGEQQDPIIHFYETFLAEYDPALRKSRGVWYTPAAVVNFMVRATDDLLKKEFNIIDGIADTSKTKVKVKTDNFEKKTNKPIYKEVEMHRIQILDPATGTGTFLASIIQYIYRTRFEMMQGMWTSYVDNHLIPRLNGFELLMASYAMAHLKMDLLLQETGYAGFSKRFEGLRPLEELENKRFEGLRPLQELENKRFEGLRPLESLENSKDNILNVVNGQKPSQSFNAKQRFRIYLTNSLEEYHPDTHTIFTQWLADEANQANAIKRDSPVMVVIGNPPYSGHSANKGAWIESLLSDYKKEPKGGRLQEKNPKWLNDDYVKFIRFGQHFVDKNKEGVLVFINNHSFLDNPTFRGMRWHLLNSFDSIYIIDLHGNTKKKETTADGKADKNVFDIQQGVSINLFVKTNKKPTNELAKVYHYDLYGTREEKYDFLNKYSLEMIPFVQIQPKDNMFFFVNKKDEFEGEYNLGFKVTDLFIDSSLGLLTKRDNLAIDFNKENIETKINFFISEDKTVEDVCSFFKIPIKDNDKWNAFNSKNKIKKSMIKTDVTQLLYRPFDNRYIFYNNYIVARMNHKILNHLIEKNYGLIIGRQGQVIGTDEWNIIYITNKLIEQNIYYRGGGTVFPLYLYKKNDNILFNENITPNFNLSIIETLSHNIGLSFHSAFVLDAPQKPLLSASHLAKATDFSSLDVLDYIYGVLHSPVYRAKYKEFLKIDFPRIPYPATAMDFWQAVAWGRELRLFHLLEHPYLDSSNRLLSANIDKKVLPKVSYPFDGDNVVEKVYFDKDCVYINDKQAFVGVPATAWNLYIGGYQPAQKWLKDRKGRALMYEDILHYAKMIGALQATVWIMGEIDK